MSEKSHSYYILTSPTVDAVPIEIDLFSFTNKLVFFSTPLIPLNPLKMLESSCYTLSDKNSVNRNQEN